MALVARDDHKCRGSVFSRDSQLVPLSSRRNGNGLPDALLFREVGDPCVFRPPADSTAVVGQVRCGTEPGAAEDPRLIRHERAELFERLALRLQGVGAV
jgi:hypothetical protein